MKRIALVLLFAVALPALADRLPLPCRYARQLRG